MRSYYVYTRSIDNEFISCNVQVSTFEGMVAEELQELLIEAARKRIKEMGYALPRNATVRFVPDPRNVEDAMGYPPDEPRRGNPGSYAVYSEYTPGETPTH